MSFDALGALLLESFIISTLILTLTYGVLRCNGSWSASLRHLIWTQSTASLVFLPLVLFLLPNWGPSLKRRMEPTIQTIHMGSGELARSPKVRSALPTDWKETHPGYSPRPETLETLEIVHLDLTNDFAASTDFAKFDAEVKHPRELSITNEIESVATLNQTSFDFKIRKLCCVVWTLGVACTCSCFAILALRMHNFIRNSVAVTDVGSGQCCRAISRNLGICQHVRLLCSVETQVPFTTGAIRPTIVLPIGYGRWTTEKLRTVLSHELTHVVRRDVATQTVAQFACVLYWFHPLVWFAAQRMRVERELACDNRVLGLGESPERYAGYLVEFASYLNDNCQPFAVTMAGCGNLEERVRAVIGSRNRWVAGRTAVGGISLLVMSVVAALSLATPSTGIEVKQSAEAMVTSEPPTRTEVETPTLPVSQPNIESYDLIAQSVTSEASEQRQLSEIHSSEVPKSSSDRPLESRSVESAATSEILNRIDEKDLRQWAIMFLRIHAEYEALALTSQQVDSLFENQLESQSFRGYRPKVERLQRERAYVKRSLAILKPEQTKLLYQYLFRRWLNENNIEPALRCFAPGEVTNLDAKLQRLQQEQLSKRRVLETRYLKDPTIITKTFAAALLKMHWAEQTQWLAKELGGERAKELVGTPSFVSCRVKYKTHSKGNGTHGFGRMHPVTGESAPTQIWGTGRDGANRPIDIPAGWTFEDAKADLDTKLKEIDALDAREKLVRHNRFDWVSSLSNLSSEERREAYRRNDREEDDIRFQKQFLGFYTMKAQLVMDRLDQRGIDENAIKKAMKQMNYGGVSWDIAEFQKHVSATPEQCTRIEDICGYEKTLYPRKHGDKISSILTEGQKKVYKQLEFRSQWFSDDCDEALASEGIKTTLEQSGQITDMKERLVKIRRGRRYVRTASRLKELVPLTQEFAATLIDIVGEDLAKQLLGQPIREVGDWKRPVRILAGSTVTTAMNHYRIVARQRDEIYANSNRLIRNLPADSEALFRDPLAFEMEKMKYDIGRIERDVAVASRVVQKVTEREAAKTSSQ